MNVGILKEASREEQRVAVIPADLEALRKAGCSVLVEQGAGTGSGFSDAEYVRRGAETADRTRVLETSEVLLTVRSAAAAGPEGLEPARKVRSGAVVIGLLDPWDPHESFTLYSGKSATLYALELLPRITRAQSMDVLSSQANLAGYKAVLLAAGLLPRIFPMMMTAAGTLVPARVFIIGAGVAGLQAIATARRLGGVVSAYDIREAVADQVESLGAKFLRMELPAGNAEGAGGYAKAMDEEFYRRQRALLKEVASAHEVIITTAAIPGKPSPLLITEDTVQAMQPGSVIVDLAAERGGNCELSVPGQTVLRHGVTIAAPLHLSSTMASHASQLFSRNITAFFLHLLSEGRLNAALDDEIRTATCVMRDGVILTDRIGTRS